MARVIGYVFVGNCPNCGVKLLAEGKEFHSISTRVSAHQPRPPMPPYD